jgi:hypothetical protein
MVHIDSHIHPCHARTDTHSKHPKSLPHTRPPAKHCMVHIDSHIHQAPHVTPRAPTTHHHLQNITWYIHIHHAPQEDPPRPGPRVARYVALYQLRRAKALRMRAPNASAEEDACACASNCSFESARVRDKCVASAFAWSHSASRWCCCQGIEYRGFTASAVSGLRRRGVGFRGLVVHVELGPQCVPWGCRVGGSWCTLPCHYQTWFPASASFRGLTMP